MSDDRDQLGRFKPGNTGGPGRPRRCVEADYLAVLSDAVPLAVWRRIVETAALEAAAGDSRARAWLSAYLLGPVRGDALTRLAGVERAGVDPVAVAAYRAWVDGVFADRFLAPDTESAVVGRESLGHLVEVPGSG